MQNSSISTGRGAHAHLPGVKLWFIDSGGAGAPVVLLHPNSGTSAIWESQIAALVEAGYRAIAFDRRGWGKSTADPATGPQPGSVTGDLDALVGHLALDKFHLIGTAGGGFIALDYAAWRPERLRSLIVGGSTGAIEDKEVADFIARIAIPEIRKQSTHYRELGPSYRGANPAGTQRWIEIDETRAPAGHRLSAAAAHAEYAFEDRGHHRAGARHRRRCRPIGAAGADAAMGATLARSRMGGHSRCRSRHGLGAAGPVQRYRAGLSRAALNGPR